MLSPKENKPEIKGATSRSVVRNVKDNFAAFFDPTTSAGIRRRQLCWVGSGSLLILLLGYGGIQVLFDGAPHEALKTAKAKETLIESGPSKQDAEKAWRYKMETDMRTASENAAALQKTFEAAIQSNVESEEKRSQELETRLTAFEDKLVERLGNQGVTSGETMDTPVADIEPKPGIQKTTLNLVEGPRHAKLKTFETTIPAGAFAKTVLLSGLDAAASMNAANDPRPMLLRLVDHGTLPRKFQSDLKDCHCTAGAFGDLSSERVYARLEKLTCIDRKTGEIIETQVAGYIAGSDGKAGIRGVVASKDGQLLSRSLIGGMFAGLSNVANPRERQSMVNPFVPGGASAVKGPGLGEQFGSGMMQGASSALDRLSQYYIDRAEQLQPVIQVAAGQVVDIVFTEGVAVGSQRVRQEIEQTRNQNRESQNRDSQKQNGDNQDCPSCRASDLSELNSANPSSPQL